MRYRKKLNPNLKILKTSLKTKKKVSGMKRAKQISIGMTKWLSLCSI
jgi:hypothetical protein